VVRRSSEILLGCPGAEESIHGSGAQVGGLAAAEGDGGLGEGMHEILTRLARFGLTDGRLLFRVQKRSA
jgi:hypothetical protein